MGDSKPPTPVKRRSRTSVPWFAIPIAMWFILVGAIGVGAIFFLRNPQFTRNTPPKIRVAPPPPDRLSARSFGAIFCTCAGGALLLWKWVDRP